jgi:hypothetical protein
MQEAIPRASSQIKSRQVKSRGKFFLKRNFLQFNVLPASCRQARELFYG